MLNNKKRLEIEKVLEEIINNYELGDRVQMFDCIGFIPDRKLYCYGDKKIKIYYAPDYEYVEIIGLEEEDFKYFFDKYGE